jgi:preprotein translocase subunit SecE
MSIFEKISKFFNEVRVELKKVSWPTRQDTVKYTLIVIGVTVVVAAFLGGCDFLFTWLLQTFLIK